MNGLISALAERSDICCDDVWVVDSIPVECARSKETVRRSEMAGWAEYGYCASHPGYFWGSRLHLVCTLHGLPAGYALTGAKADERQVFLDILAGTPARNRLQADGRRQVLIGDKNYHGADFEDTVDQSGIELLRPARKGEKPRAGAWFVKALRQIVESINDTLKGQLDLEQHGGRTPAEVMARVIQRLMVMTAAIGTTTKSGQTSAVH